ncbi:hypothetical protein CCR75_002929 [Bremia lactucae]|uniref:Uncharacterized protein n=1 Tax=Bremia lactucae TaxID=4779 RepID=A0A976FQ55_BRELC|nr:hypothetical protein CCR75_002929 [Bremia lactucae]
MTPGSNLRTPTAELIHQKLTNDYSTLRYKIEYNNYMSNHILHAVVALYELGASEQKIVEYAEHYTQKLEAESPDHEDVVKNAATAVVLSSQDAQALLGKRQEYDALLAYYARDVKKFGAEDAVRKHLSHLFSGMGGALLHGIIQLGFSYYFFDERLVSEGLAYLHYSYLPFDKPEESLCDGPLDFTRSTVMNLVSAVISDSSLRSEQDRIVAVSPLKDLNIGWIQRGLTALSGHPTLGSPKAFSIIGNYINNFNFTKFNSYVALDMIMWLFVMLEHNDFIMLHAVTSAWSLQQLKHLISPKKKAWRVWLQVALSALVTSRVCDFRSKDICKPSENLKDRLAALPSWSQLREKALTVPGFPDEHVFKMVFIAQEYAKSDMNGYFLTRMEREFVARTAALVVISKPFQTVAKPK